MILNSLLSIHSVLEGEAGRDACLRTVNFMSYELAATCASRNDESALSELNNFFFEKKSFRIGSDNFLPQQIVEERTGCGVALSLLYMHLAQGLGLNLELVHWPLHSLLKWDQGGRSRFVDMERKGKLLSEDEILGLINKHKGEVRTLPLSEALVEYLSHLSVYFRLQKNNECLLKTLSLILDQEPENTRVLVERALLRREMGFPKEALNDLKRYFAFADKSAVAPEVLTAYDELRSLTL